MLREIIVPTLGLDIEEVVIERWLKSEGEIVAADEPLLSVETEKATMEINAPASGVVRQIVQPAGMTVRVLQVVGFLEASEESEVAVGATGPSEDPAATPAPVVAAHSAAPRVPSVVRASPAARRAARDLGVALSEVQGTGPGGRVQEGDVRRYLAARGGRPDQPVSTPAGVAPDTLPASVVTTSGSGEMAAAAAGVVESVLNAPAMLDGLPGRLVPLGRKRRVTAERMSASAQSVARVTLNADVDARELVRLRERLRPVYEQMGEKPLSYDAVLVKVVATALVAFPYLNARWTPDGIYLIEQVNVGVAIAVDDGLVVPVVRGADRKSLLEISRELNALLADAQADRLALENMKGGTFTLTNLGMYGIDSFTPIVNPPEAAILGVGRIAERAVGCNGELVLRPLMTLSLSFDHRIVDGAPAAQFLQRVCQLLEEPLLLL